MHMTPVYCCRGLSAARNFAVCWADAQPAGLHLVHTLMQRSSTAWDQLVITKQSCSRKEQSLKIQGMTANQAVASAALRLPKVLSFSSLVWKRPWPNLEAVSMNLSLISSRADLLVLGNKVCLNVMTRFLVPGMAP